MSPSGGDAHILTGALVEAPVAAPKTAAASTNVLGIAPDAGKQV